MLQFRLRTLFIATTAVAVAAWALFAPPQWLGLLAIYLIYCLLPAATVAGIVFMRGNWQAFFIGMAPWIAVISYANFLSVSIALSGPAPLNDYLFTGAPDDIILYKLNLAVLILIALASGLVSVCIRWWATAVRRQ